MQAPQRRLIQKQNGAWLWELVFEYLYRPLTLDLTGNLGGGWNQVIGPDGQWHVVGITGIQGPGFGAWAKLFPAWAQQVLGAALAANPPAAVPIFAPADFNQLFNPANLTTGGLM